jgi:hypothetical protein
MVLYGSVTPKQVWEWGLACCRVVAGAVVVNLSSWVQGWGLLPASHPAVCVWTCAHLLHTVLVRLLLLQLCRLLLLLQLAAVAA